MMLFNQLGSLAATVFSVCTGSVDPTTLQTETAAPIDFVARNLKTFVFPAMLYRQSY